LDRSHGKRLSHQRDPAKLLVAPWPGQLNRYALTYDDERMAIDGNGTLPEMQSDIMEAETPMALWVQIVHAFDEAYEQPQNDDFIKRVYQYADWCLQDVVKQRKIIFLLRCNLFLGTHTHERNGSQGPASLVFVGTRNG
jgi:hypothetical protein